MDYGILNVRTDVNTCDCTRGCTDTVRESALKVDSGRKIPCRTGESNLLRQRAGSMLKPTELHPIPVLMQMRQCLHRVVRLKEYSLNDKYVDKRW